jgi:Outer membrane protein beta-barrel domain
MKNILVLVLLLCIGHAANAQFGSLQSKSFYVGIRGGANFSKLKTDDVPNFFKNNAANRTGYVVGVFVRVGRKFYVQPELLISSKGGTIEAFQGGKPVNVDVKFSQIDIPFLLGYKMGPLRLNAGPMASLNISQGSALRDAWKQYTTQNVNETIKQASFGYQAGVGLDIGSFNVDLRYEGSLSSITPLVDNNNAQFNSKVSLWQLTLGLVLF